MTNAEITAPNSPKLIRLRSLATQIRELSNSIDSGLGEIRSNMLQTLSRANETGSLLLAAKEICGHGNFLDWMKSSCPTVSYASALRYMNVAKNWATISHAANMAQALRMLSAPEEKEDGDSTPKTRLPYLEALNKFTRVNDFIARHPITDWPKEGVDELANQLRPIASQLWPDQFKSS